MTLLIIVILFISYWREYKTFCMCNIFHVYVNYANVLKGLQFPTPTLFVLCTQIRLSGWYNVSIWSTRTSKGIPQWTIKKYVSIYPYNRTDLNKFSLRGPRYCFTTILCSCAWWSERCDSLFNLTKGILTYIGPLKWSINALLTLVMVKESTQGNQSTRTDSDLTLYHKS